MFDYTIIRSNRKTLSVIVERDKQVIVRAPEQLTEQKIHEAVYSKRLLIEKKLNSNQKYVSDFVPKEFVSGESFLYLGTLYPLEVVENGSAELQFKNKFLIGASNSTTVKQKLFEWYFTKAKEVLVPRIEHFAEFMGANHKRINVTNAKYTWGSCTPNGTLNFNWRLIKAPIDVIDYIVVHELAHLQVPNHSHEFWHIVSVQLPNYEDAKEWLKENGGSLDEDF